MKVKIVVLLMLSFSVALFSQSGGWIRFNQLFSGDRRGAGNKVQMASGTVVTGDAVKYDATGSLVPAGATTKGMILVSNGTAVTPLNAGTTGQVLTVNSAAATGLEYATPAASSAAIPAGAVMAFNLSSCPSGWTAHVASRGRYIVGLPSGGSLASVVGTALSNTENRAVGQHTHTVDDPGHTHNYGKADVPGSSTSGANTTFTAHLNVEPTASATTGITNQNSGSVTGTNAPYVQLLMCEKQ